VPKHQTAMNHTTKRSSPGSICCVSTDTGAVVLMAGLSTRPPNQLAPLALIICSAHAGIPAASACSWKALASACSASTLAFVIWSCSAGFVRCSSVKHTLFQMSISQHTYCSRLGCTLSKFEQARLVQAKANCKVCSAGAAAGCIVRNAHFQLGVQNLQAAEAPTAVLDSVRRGQKSQGM
jgi:hypothetical protein